VLGCTYILRHSGLLFSPRILVSYNYFWRNCALRSNSRPGDTTHGLVLAAYFRTLDETTISYLVNSTYSPHFRQLAPYAPALIPQRGCPTRRFPASIRRCGGSAEPKCGGGLVVFQDLMACLLKMLAMQRGRAVYCGYTVTYLWVRTRNLRC
jgi:hypothetical protein